MTSKRRRKATLVNPRGRSDGVAKLDTDDALIALLIGATDASGHTSAEEEARAYHIIWSMRRFRYRSGEAIRRRIARVQALIEKHGTSPVIEAASRQIPAGLRRAAFAVAADLVLVDGRLQRAERRFLEGLAADLRLERETATRVLDVMRIKNSA